MLLAFIAVAAVLIITPGPDTALTIRNVLAGGRRAGIGTSLGVSTGQLIWALAASVGVAALLRASEPAFLAVKLAGAAYLTWLGLRSLWAAVRGQAHEAPPVTGVLGRATLLRSFRQGLLCNLGNPKMAVFVTSLLPQFVPRGEPVFAAMLSLGGLFALMTVTWLIAYSVVLAGLGNVFRRSRVRRALDSITGLALIGFGARLAAERA